MDKKEAALHHVKAFAFLAKASSNHWVAVESMHHGEPAAATGPMELVLVALGGCTGADVANILEKKRAAFTRFEINISGERAETHPKVFTKIHIEYILEGKDLRASDVEQAIELSQSTYCSVSAMLKKTAEITCSYKLLKSPDAQ
ncbi:MAG: OsmC family protein [Bacteroidota bacterium]|nr:OsmC family protein [Bacteroidota bacterium]